MGDYTLILNEQERAELLLLLENSFMETRVEARRTDTPGYRADVQKEEQVLRGLVAKLKAQKPAK